MKISPPSAVEGGLVWSDDSQLAAPNAPQKSTVTSPKI